MVFPPTTCRLLFLVLQQTTRRVRAAWVNGRGVLLDVLDDAFLVHHKRCPVGKPVLVIQDSVILGDDPLEVAQEWEGEAFLFGKHFVGRGAIDADPEYLRFGLLEFGDISLIRL